VVPIFLGGEAMTQNKTSMAGLRERQQARAERVATRLHWGRVRAARKKLETKRAQLGTVLADLEIHTLELIKASTAGIPVEQLEPETVINLIDTGKIAVFRGVAIDRARHADDQAADCGCSADSMCPLHARAPERLGADHRTLESYKSRIAPLRAALEKVRSFFHSYGDSGLADSNLLRRVEETIDDDDLAIARGKR
jgi:hypothetical protein